jgi:uncharacterized coiled-coil protein SlyX
MKRFGSSVMGGKEMEAEVKAARPWAEEGEEGEEDRSEGVGAAADKHGRVRVPRAEKRRRALERAAAAAALKASEVGPTDNNQGLPGSVEGGRPMRETEAGQSQQEEEDEIFKDPRIVALIDRHNKNDDVLRKELADCDKSLDFRQREIDKHKETIRKQKAAIAQQERLAGDVSCEFEKALQEVKDAQAATEASNKRFKISEDLMTRTRNESVAITSALKEATEAKHQLEEQFDEAGVYAQELEDRIDDLERRVAAQETVATENTTLKGEIAEVHSSFEDVFSDMAKGLTINEKFAYVREHKNTAPAPAPARRPRIVSTSSLHEELDDHSDDHHSDAGSEHIKAPTREPFTFSGTQSVETAPVAPVVAPPKKPAPTREPFSFSGITSIETAPVAPIVAPVKKPAPMREPFSFSGTTSIETAPVAPVVAQIKKPAPVREPFDFSGITSIETAPVGPEVAPIKKPAPEIRVQWRTRWITEHVDRPVVPWWMWLIFLIATIAIIACASGFASLLRENQIWFDANDMAYQRLMGAEQETLLASVSMGVQDLLPGMGGMGLSLFG